MEANPDDNRTTTTTTTNRPDPSHQTVALSSEKEVDRLRQLNFEELKEEEEDDAYRLVEFSSADAWNMGNVLRSSALTLLSRRRDVTPPGLVFRIQLLSGLVLFQISVGRESSLRLMEMVEKKINVVRTYAHSSLAIGRKLVQQGRSVDSLGPEYAAHGGAFPIRVAGLEAPVAVVAVSGLDQETDHALAREAIREIAERQKAAKAKGKEELDISKKQI